VKLNLGWSDRAACNDLPTSMFYPDRGSRHWEPPPDEKRAKRVCARCPVRTECLTYALTIESEALVIGSGIKGTHQATITIKPRAWGIWAGHTSKERTLLGIRHTDDCDQKGHGWCRPIPEQVELLEERFRSRAHITRILMPDEEVRRSA
jgi:hypothetical protein